MPLTFLSAGSLAVSTEGSALPSMACAWVYLQAEPTNATHLFVGGSGAQTIKLSAGATLELLLSNLSQVMAKTSAGLGSATVNWLCHPIDWR